MESTDLIGKTALAAMAVGELSQCVSIASLLLDTLRDAAKSSEHTLQLQELLVPVLEHLNDLAEALMAALVQARAELDENLALAHATKAEL